MLFYNLPGAWTIHYNNAWALNWQGDDGNKWTIPLGAGVSKTFMLGGGNGLDLSLGLYGMIARPEGGPNSQLKFGLSWLIPR
jgi:hypothetical protein